MLSGFRVSSRPATHLRLSLSFVPLISICMSLLYNDYAPSLLVIHIHNASTPTVHFPGVTLTQKQIYFLAINTRKFYQA